MSKGARCERASSENFGGQALGLLLAVTLLTTLAIDYGMTCSDGIFVVAGVPVMAVVWIVLSAFAVMRAIDRVKHHRRVAAILPALVPVIAVGMIWQGYYVGALVHFELARPGYVARIAAARSAVVDADFAGVRPTVAFFAWGGFLSNTYGIVYDAGDVITKPLRVRQEAWQTRRVPGELLCDGSVMPFGGHFYYGSFTC
ncbi:MAG TPA: hypothetical protein VMA53_04140 [Stellaceae bacterium]|nr:hypothetical protein [Stellaceae bacterium]